MKTTLVAGRCHSNVTVTTQVIGQRTDEFGDYRKSISFKQKPIMHPKPPKYQSSPENWRIFG